MVVDDHLIWTQYQWDVSFLAKRFKEKAFARGANRETMMTYTEIGLSFEEYLGLGLEAMQGIAKEIGL